MIAIKMDMPKNAETCRFRHSIYDWCVIDKKPLKRNKFDKCLSCPIIALPEENKDMSWEELKIKCDNLTTDIQFSSDGFDFECKGIWFNKVGTIFSSKLNIEDLTPYQMYQIIKALGDER